ncbi:hypothetical protein [Paludisphaera sp.]|uniref:hypothetical protein n=1 Tax=Paludisphaera sp. TaxID=2017432 RepID=UPI00301E23F0
MTSDELRDTLDSVRKRPFMHLTSNKFTSLVDYINGIDTASNGRAILALREWLVLSVGFGGNLTWDSLLIFKSCPGVDHDTMKSIYAGGRESVDAFDKGIGVLIDFLNEVGSDLERDSIMRAYDAWAKDRA